jgi:hypothetical protein
MWRGMLLLAGGLLLTGCADSYTRVTAPFRDGDYQPFIAAGQTTLTGSAIRAKQGAPAALCTSVMLMPKTAFTTDFVAARRRGPGYLIMSPPDGKPYYMPKAVRQAECDKAGGFVIKDLPAGTWFVLPEMPEDKDELLSEVTTDGVNPSTANLTEHDLLRTAW